MSGYMRDEQEMPRLDQGQKLICCDAACGATKLISEPFKQEI